MVDEIERPMIGRLRATVLLAPEKRKQVLRHRLIVHLDDAAVYSLHFKEADQV